MFEDCLLIEKELGILFLDIDNFKLLIVRYGHGRGDEGICAVEDTLKKCFPEDYVARYGGDEFLVVMTGRDREYAEEHARQLCMGIRECEIPNEDSSVEPWLTISAGGVCAIPKEPNRVWDFLSAADKTLFVLKNEQKINKNVIAYIVSAISEFSKSHHLSVREASNYLIRFKGIDFITEHYDAEHLLSFDDCVQDLTQVCLNNGGGIR